VSRGDANGELTKGGMSTVGPARGNNDRDVDLSAGGLMDNEVIGLFSSEFGSVGFCGGK
jgi:hypothetical protein